MSSLTIPPVSHRVALFVLALLSIVVVGFLWLLLQLLAAINRPPPFEYSAIFYTAENPMLCAGDSLVYTSTLIVNRPAVTTRIRTIWDEGQHQTAVAGNNRDEFIWTEATVITQTEIVPLPLSLLPGKYELRTARYEERTAPQTHSVPFEIVENCP